MKSMTELMLLLTSLFIIFLVIQSGFVGQLVEQPIDLF